MLYTENDSKLGFWRRRLCPKFLSSLAPCLSAMVARSRTKIASSLLAKFPSFKSFSVYNFLLCMLAVHVQLFAVSPAVIGPAVYAQVQSIDNQIVTQNKINQPILINLQSVNNISGIEWDSVNNRMIVRHAGVYVILTDMMVGTQMNGDVFFWIERNGSPIFESGKKQTLSPQFETIPVSNSWIMPLDENDSLRFMFSATVPTVALITTQGSKNIPNYPTAYTPNSPGFNATMFMLKK